MTRTKIKYRNARGQHEIGYAILPIDSQEDTYFWCFDSKDDDYGFTLHTGDIVSVFH